MIIGRIIQIFYWFFIFVLLTTAAYILLLQPTLSTYFNSKKASVAAQAALQQKKLFAVSDNKITTLLRQWKHQHPHFYASIQSTQTIDQLLQSLTQCAQQSGFSIVQAAPINPPKRKEKSDAQIQLKLLGNYSDLFYFIDQLNTLAWPLTVFIVNIQKPNQFTLQIIARGFHA